LAGDAHAVTTVGTTGRFPIGVLGHCACACIRGRPASCWRRQTVTLAVAVMAALAVPVVLARAGGLALALEPVEASSAAFPHGSWRVG
jgi:hypothetical protein